MASMPKSPGGPAKPPESAKRSEINELRAQLRSLEIQRDPKRYRETVQKVIMFMTLGIDVSRLFSEMIMASATQDVVQKKLVYLYLCSYAESHSDITLLAVNTLQKDCADSNPMVRGLALRAMCGLRVPNLTEYVMIPLQSGLHDKSPYVRRTAIMGCVKLFYTAEHAIKDNNIPEVLLGMLQDRDAGVVANSVIALEEILASSGGLLVTKDIAYLLLNRIKEFSEWHQCSILTLLNRYAPANDDETFDILNILDDRLKNPNSGVLLAAAKLFLNLTKDIQDIQEDIYDRLKVPLITVMSTSSAEVCFTVLHHIQVLILKHPQIFARDFKAFYARFNDPSYVKWKKLEILTEIADEHNMVEIVEELSAYVTDIDVEMARRSIRAVGRIAIRLPAVVDKAFTMFLGFLELDIAYVTAETLLSARDVLRKYGDFAEDMVPQILKIAELDSLASEPLGRAALLWFLGEYGELIEDAPYILEDMVERIEEETSPAVRLQMLTSAMKLFFKRAPETQRILGRLLHHEIEDDLHTDVHDRALLYYRLLKNNLPQAERIIAGSAQITADFIEFAPENKDRLMEEFNTLSVIYGQSSENFIVQTPPYNVLGMGSVGTGVKVSGGGASSSEGRGGDGAREGSLVAVDAFTPSAMLQLNPNPEIDPQTFEQIWMSSSVGAIVKDVLCVVPTSSTPSDIQRYLAQSGIKLMASSPPQNNLIKFFFYGQEKASGVFHLMEATLELDTRTITGNVKSKNLESAPLFSFIVREALSRGGLISMGL